jgi:hypothetical protein
MLFLSAKSAQSAVQLFFAYGLVPRTSEPDRKSLAISATMGSWRNDMHSAPVFGAFTLLPCFLVLLVLGFALASVVLWIWALIDCAQNEPAEGNDKIIWILIIIFTHAIGALLYIFIRRPERIRKFGR